MIIQVEKVQAKVGDWTVSYISEVLPSPGDFIDVAFEGEEFRKYEVVRVNHILRKYETKDSAGNLVESRVLSHRPVVVVK
jgi:hypothetical protein